MSLPAGSTTLSYVTLINFEFVADLSVGRPKRDSFRAKVGVCKKFFHYWMMPR
jgi:hypothetical protein